MGNLSVSLKKFLQNKNTVTVVGVVLAIIVLYFAYTMRINSAISPVTVPYAAEQIPAGTQITESMISTREVPPAMLEGDVIQNIGEIVDKYSAADTVIPQGSLFYKRTVVEKEQLPANIILEYPKNYVLYNLPVDTETTYGNSVYPGNYIDIWLKAVNKLTEQQIQQGVEFAINDTAEIDRIFTSCGKTNVLTQVIVYNEALKNKILSLISPDQVPQFWKDNNIIQFQS